MSRVVPSPTLGQPATGSVQIPREKIAMRAYEKWVKRGRQHGGDMQDWVEAERELKAEAARTSGPQSARR